MARTALNTTINRTITGTANHISVSNGDGVAGNPALDIPSGVSLPNASMGTGYLSSTKTAGSTGVTANLLVKIDTTGNVVTAAAGDTGILGVALATVASGDAVEVAISGIVNCVADNTTVIGDVLIVGTTTAGRCRDATGIAMGTQMIGKALTAVAAGSAGCRAALRSGAIRDRNWPWIRRRTCSPRAAERRKRRRRRLLPAVTALVNGLYACWLPAAANTGAAPTFAPNGLTAKPITKLGTDGTGRQRSHNHCARVRVLRRHGMAIAESADGERVCGDSADRDVSGAGGGFRVEQNHSRGVRHVHDHAGGVRLAASQRADASTSSTTVPAW